MVKDTLYLVSRFYSHLPMLGVFSLALPFFFFPPVSFFLLVAFTGWSLGFTMCSPTPSFKEKHLNGHVDGGTFLLDLVLRVAQLIGNKACDKAGDCTT